MVIGKYTTESIEAVLNEERTRASGLTDGEASKRLAFVGPNALDVHGISIFTLILRQIKSPLIYMLFGAAILAIILGEKSDGIIILVFVFVNILISFLQEYHSARSLLLLKKFITPHAKVIRDGKEIMIDAATLVPGDIVIVSTGDVIDADMRFIETAGLSINESILSGESSPATKSATSLSVSARDISEATNIGFSGTTVTAGRGVGVVFATGKNTEIGGIAKLTVETEHLSSFEDSINMFSRFIMKMVVVILVVLLLINLIVKGSTNMVELLLFTVALAISVIPEALPMVTTLSLSKGALDLARHHVVVKRLSAIEDLGSIEILCTDKTGTLTENQLQVSSVYADDPHLCLEYAALGSSEEINPRIAPVDTFDLAIWKKMTEGERAKLDSYEYISSIPFEPIRRRTSAVVKQVHTGKIEVVVRGAPETILGISTITADEAAKIHEWVKNEGMAGRRTVAIAHGVCTHTNSCEKDEKKLTFLGCVSFIDPVKSTTASAIADAGRLGVEVVILTGDGPEVSGTVARDVGILTDRTQVITESEFLALSPVRQNEVVHTYKVFARMSPAGKYRVIELLSKNKSVGYLGDGINDAPALKMASVGLVVANASDIARDAADIVLLNSSLHVIIGGIRSGRAVFENTVKYLKTTLISSFGNFYTIAIAQLILPFLPMLSIQILLLNLMTDYPMLAIATDTVDSHDIKKPHKYNVRDILLVSIVLGLVSTLFDFVFFAIFRHSGAPVLQTNWFIGSVLTELVLLFAIRTRLPFWKAKAPSRWLTILSVSAGLVTILLPFTSVGRNFFKFQAPTINHLLIIFLVIGIYFVVTESVKLTYYRFLNHS